MLRIENVHVYYGNIHAVKGVSLNVPEGAIVALLGANGAGKSTTLRAISGLLPLRSGTIWFRDRRLPRTPDKIVRAGLSHVPEGRQVFGDLTVLENLLIGAFVRTDRAAVRDDLERVLQLFPRLRERSGQAAQTLSGGEQQMLSLGRALMSRPKLLLLDEPSLGLAPVVVNSIIETVISINREGATILLVEQNSELALAVSTYAYVLENGRVALQGDSSALVDNPEVKNSYLGGTTS